MSNEWIELSKGIKILKADQMASIPDPLLRIETNLIPSWNDYLSRVKGPDNGHGFIKKWRKIGAKIGIDSCRKADIPILEWTESEFSKSGALIETDHARLWTIHIHRPVDLIMRMWRPDLAVYDVLNPCVKPIIDGFVDAWILAKDSTEIIRSGKFEYMGVDRSLALSKEAKAERKIKAKFSNARMPKACRFWFDFYLAKD